MAGPNEERALLVAETPAQVRELHAWLREEPALRNAIRLVESPPPQGALGPVAEAVQILANSPELIATIAGVVIAWLRLRTSDVKITVRRQDGTEASVSASRVRMLSNKQTHAIVAEVQQALSSDVSGQVQAELGDGPPGG